MHATWAALSWQLGGHVFRLYHHGVCLFSSHIVLCEPYALQVLWESSLIAMKQKLSSPLACKLISVVWLVTTNALEAESSGPMGQATGVSSMSTVCTGLVEVSSGIHHTCAIHQDRTVLCWGDNTYGQLGDGTATIV